MTVRRLLNQTRMDLASHPEGRREAEILLCHALDVPRSWLYANPDEVLSDEGRLTFQKLVQRRQQGEPIAYITGIREFWSLPLKITPAVLVPRPETELLVETVLAQIPTSECWRIADLGTGSGAIALALASERPACEIHATDISQEALAIARENAQALGLEQIRFHQGRWLEPLLGSFQCIVSNPPYVSQTDPHMRQGDCRFEPEIALTPGDDALASIRHIAETALAQLVRGGLLAFEHGYDQGADSRQILRQLGYEEIKTIKDLAGHERVTVGRSC